ncbi:hypothetical protein E1A91_A10G119400v1 [Gossypium mustelinum]|uniref:Uncharacterized protein n=1 Tax=Gossypium mustelinum TaxID=34275 RepID=A0A5D2XN77_GOSMU|nr:hypothetical protein E1A91_A10G119400v1 [Gossypium mustelinum]TYJ14441.1 hypothetical protein E1A91_A10G119400v1 [Gossypium mustelinum]
MSNSYIIQSISKINDFTHYLGYSFTKATLDLKYLSIFLSFSSLKKPKYSFFNLSDILFPCIQICKVPWILPQSLQLPHLPPCLSTSTALATELERLEAN